MARILFLGIDYYHYSANICAAFERLGHDIDFRPMEDRGFASKSLKKFAPGAYRRRLDAYHDRVIEESAGRHYDVVLFIQVHEWRHEAVARLRALHRDAHFVLYNWDSLTTHDFTPWMRHFDSVATFDPDDAKALGITYLPLFAIPRFFAIDPARPREHDIYFVGSIGSMERFDALARLHAFCEDAGLKTRFHLLCSPVIRTMLLRRGRSLPGLTGSPIGFDGIVDLIETSRATFDFANHRQSGYTMRLIENMCAGCKIVTENPRILDEPFYREDRFLLVDGHDFSALPEFLARPVTSDLDVGAFHVDAWARTLIAGQKVLS
ncbi:hypothetical protein [Erythrobacter sp. HL-111]|uniref:hypothetical protein n=1 Tax=Erythrobacter sp. HL-111 TaxID=1798193 RepID=UPI0006DA2414|nr:hypothetical protein [Erythrobacter sp. HL-111]KPP95478.1 MAG: hypothetical protein HLUCCO15_02365 [Erythrobacteraceae bacterium HL-111]SDS72487.1 hypothetical protein SAMN04515621_2106 [Erythrobacter sp. HL-111]